MKKLFPALLFFFLAGGLHGPAFAENINKTGLTSILANAALAGSNAQIYQWKRVNLEVDRIDSSARKIQKTMQSDTTHANQAAAFREAIQALDTARLNHDSAHLTLSTQKLIDLCMQLEK